MAFKHSSSHYLGVPSVDLLVFVSTCVEAFKRCRASRSLAKTGFIMLIFDMSNAIATVKHG